jgi:hypothetical protein
MRIWWSMALMRSGERCSGMSDSEEVSIYYAREGASESIRVIYGSLFDGDYVDLDIRDAVFLRYQLDGAIQDYERAVGK